MAKKRRVGLFTNIHPDIGGGAVNFRSIISELGDFEITWFHLGSGPSGQPGSEWLGENLFGGPVLRDLARFPVLMGGIAEGQLGKIAGEIRSRRFDSHWILAMNEGVGIGNILLRSAPNVPLHVSVQDDQLAWTWCRSRRYKWFGPFMRRTWRRLLTEADSVDVISNGMKSYYAQQFGLNAAVVHVYVPQLPRLDPVRPHPDWLSIGHIGSIYDWGDFSAFLLAARSWATSRAKKLKLTVVGFGGDQKLLLEAKPDALDVIPSLTEPEAVEALHKCDIVYAMYPFKAAARNFRQTSLPTKLSTYVQARRPIFAHTPGDSSLAWFVSRFGVGVVAPHRNISDLAGCLDGSAGLEIAEKNFERAREEVFGYKNVENMRACLSSR